jgi:hypothetical protein
MAVKKLGLCDAGNTSFLPHIGSLKHVKAGFDAGETGSVSPGHHRLPRRKTEDEIPQEPLAARVRSKRSGR